MKFNVPKFCNFYDTTLNEVVKVNKSFDIVGFFFGTNGKNWCIFIVCYYTGLLDVKYTGYISCLWDSFVFACRLASHALNLEICVRIFFNWFDLEKENRKRPSIRISISNLLNLYAGNFLDKVELTYVDAVPLAPPPDFFLG